MPVTLGPHVMIIHAFGLRLRRSPGLIACLALLQLVTVLGIAVADDVRDPANRGCEVRREGHALRITIADDGVRDGAVELPRFHAALRSIRWATGGGDAPILQPEPRHWILRWKGLPPTRDVVLEFADLPLLVNELVPELPAPDGSFLLSACDAIVAGEKLRFEPQPHKNTVGFWTTATDSASWDLDGAKAGAYSVAILQGCGAGQGGSTAMLTLGRDGRTVARVPFTITETGHFQNFRWFDIGTLTFSEAGRHRVTVAPERIAKAALGDIRAIALVPLAVAPPAVP